MPKQENQKLSTTMWWIWWWKHVFVSTYEKRIEFRGDYKHKKCFCL